MKKQTRGSSPLHIGKYAFMLICISFVFAVLGILYRYQRQVTFIPNRENKQRAAMVEDIAAEEISITSWMKYENNQYHFSFRHPPELTVVPNYDNLYNQDTFTDLLGYSPPEIIADIIVGQNRPPFRLWVLENPSKLSIKDWYKKYQYFPEVWGQRFNKDTIAEAPTSLIKLGNDIALFSPPTDNYQLTRYGYLMYGNRLFLFAVNKASESLRILSTFQTTE